MLPSVYVRGLQEGKEAFEVFCISVREKNWWRTTKQMKRREFVKKYILIMYNDDNISLPKEGSAVGSVVGCNVGSVER